jgi:hypothetical protein
MSQAVILGVVALMMMCSSSSAAMLMMGGDDTKSLGPTGPAGPAPPTEYKYEFIIEAPHHSTLGAHMSDVLVDGQPAPEGSIVLHKDPDRDNTDPISSLYDNVGSSMVTYNVTEPKGTKFMTITLKTRPKKFTIRYGRPLYAPGWLIKENGKEIIKETANRGSEMTPSPQEYDYVLP